MERVCLLVVLVKVSGERDGWESVRKELHLQINSRPGSKAGFEDGVVRKLQRKGFPCVGFRISRL